MGNSTKVILKFFGILVIIGSIFIYMLSAATGGQYDALTGLAVFLLIVGIILFIIGKKLPKSKQICGNCGFVAETKRELHNHSLTCEKQKTKQVPNDPSAPIGTNEWNAEPTQETKYFQCKYCKMVFEKEVEQLNHYLICETKKKVESHKEIDEKPKDSFKQSAKLIRDEDSSLEELKRKIREDREED